MTPSAQRRSNERSKGQLGELSADTDVQLHPDSTRSFNPNDEEKVSEGEFLTMKTNVSKQTIKSSNTWQSVDKPRELFLGYFSPGKVQCNRLALDDPGQSLRTDGLATAQTDMRPQAFITTPITYKKCHSEPF